jgi:hypothetical protein
VPRRKVYHRPKLSIVAAHSKALDFAPGAFLAEGLQVFSDIGVFFSAARAFEVESLPQK